MPVGLCSLVGGGRSGKPLLDFTVIELRASGDTRKGENFDAYYNYHIFSVKLTMFAGFSYSRIRRKLVGKKKA